MARCGSTAQSRAQVNNPCLSSSFGLLLALLGFMAEKEEEETHCLGKGEMRRAERIH